MFSKPLAASSPNKAIDPVSFFITSLLIIHSPLFISGLF
jgi:hypothetical protein